MRNTLKYIIIRCKLSNFYCWKCQRWFCIPKCKFKYITFDSKITYLKAECPHCKNLIIKFHKRIDKTI